MDAALDFYVDPELPVSHLPSLSGLDFTSLLAPSLFTTSYVPPMHVLLPFSPTST